MTADGEGVELSEKLFEEESEELPPQETKSAEEANTAAAARTTRSFFFMGISEKSFVPRKDYEENKVK